MPTALFKVKAKEETRWRARMPIALLKVNAMEGNRWRARMPIALFIPESTE
jgi:hypothetical protein